MDGLCQRWGQLPSAVLAEDGGLILAILDVIGENSPAAVQQVSEDDVMRARLIEMAEA